MLISFIGVFNGIFFMLGILILVSLNKGFSYSINTLSILGAFERTANLWKLFFMLFSFNQLVFVLVLIDKFGMQVGLIILLLTSVLGVFVGNIRTNVHYVLHRSLGALALCFTPIAGILFALVMYSHKPVVSVISIIICLAMLASLTPFLKAKTLVAKYEMVFFLGLILWNCLSTVLLF